MIGGTRLHTGAGQNNMRYLENIAHMPVRDLQGSKDDPNLVRNLRLAFEKLKQMNAVDAELIEFPELGHSFKLSAVNWGEFWGAARREPLPSRVVRMVAAKNPTERRAFWLEVLATTKQVQENFRIKVTPEEYKRWEKKGKHLLLIQEAEKHTGRVEASMIGTGRFKVKARYVRKVRILLTGKMFERGKPVEVTFNGRKRKATPLCSKRVLVPEFAERFDRTFLPVAKVDV
jgi:hypothetical protein